MNVRAGILSAAAAGDRVLTVEQERADSGRTTSWRSRLFPACAWVLFAAAVGVSAWSLFSEGIVFQLVRSDLEAAEKVQRLRTFFDSFGPFGPLVYFVCVVVEVVVAPIPGLMLYAPGGALFGTLIGGTTALAGNVAGAGIACAMTRGLGFEWMRRYMDTQRLEQVQGKIERHGAWLIFLLRLNPLTSSDLVSYAAGFTRIPVWKVMWATAAGMAPLCYAQSWLAESLLSRYPHLLYPLIVASLGFVVFVVLILRRVSQPGDGNPSSGS